MKKQLEKIIGKQSVIAISMITLLMTACEPSKDFFKETRAAASTDNGLAESAPEPVPEPTPQPVPQPTPLPDLVDLTKPDLIVTSVSTVASSLFQNDQVVFVVTIRNIGGVASPPFPGLAFSVGGQKVTWAWREEAIAAGETITLTANGGPFDVNYFTADQVGILRVEAFVDDNNRFDEGNESNNKLVQEFMVNAR